MFTLSIFPVFSSEVGNNNKMKISTVAQLKISLILSLIFIITRIGYF